MFDVQPEALPSKPGLYVILGMYLFLQCFFTNASSKYFFAQKIYQTLSKIFRMTILFE